MLDVKKEAWRMFAGLGFVIGLWYVIVHFRLVAWQVVTLLIGVNIVFNLFAKFKFKKPFSFKSLLKTVLTIAALVYGIRFLNKIAGGWSFIITIAVIIVYILFSRWKQYLEVKEHIETMIWGKPLKEFIKEGKKPKRGEKVD